MMQTAHLKSNIAELLCKIVSIGGIVTTFGSHCASGRAIHGRHSGCPEWPAFRNAVRAVHVDAKTE